MTLKGSKSIENVLAACRAQGASVEVTKRGHIRVRPADKTKPLVIASGTPGDRRALDEFITRLRRSGIRYPYVPERKRSETKE